MNHYRLDALLILPRGEVIFAGFGCVETFYLHYAKLLGRAGLPTTRRFKPQCLRRTFASYLERVGGDATAALQHSSRKVTQQSYLDPRVCGSVDHADVVKRAYRFDKGGSP